MEADTMSETQWRETLISISQEEANSPTRIHERYPIHIYRGMRLYSRGTFRYTKNNEDSDNGEDDDDDDDDDDDNNDDDDADDDDDDDNNDDNDNANVVEEFERLRRVRVHEHKKKIVDQRDSLMMRMPPLFITQPKLETICKQKMNRFIDS